jgi:hypothetical protein
MGKALSMTEELFIDLPESGVRAGPNPTRGEIEFTFSDPPGNITVEVITATGSLVYRKNFGDYAGRSLRLSALNNREQGLYFVKLMTASGKHVFRIVKLRERP